MKQKDVNIEEQLDIEESVEKSGNKKRKPFVSLDHTLGVINKISDELTRCASIFNIISMVAFLAYYAYLIYLNTTSVPHLVAYAILCACTVTSFIVEMVFNNQGSYLRSEETRIQEKKKIIVLATKCLKYSAKLVAVVMSLVAMIKAPGSNTSIITAIFSGLLLTLQILLEVVVVAVRRYVDHITMAVEMDMENSIVVDILRPQGSRIIKKEKKYIEMQKKSYYTEKQEKMRKVIAEEAEKYSKEQDRKEKKIKEAISNTRKVDKIKEKERKLQEKLAKEEEKRIRAEEKIKANEMKNFADILDTPEIAEN